MTLEPKLSLVIHSNLSRLQVVPLSVVVLLCALGARGVAATGAERYTGVMTHPIDLFTQEGTKLEKGKYNIEVVPDGTHWTLAFLSVGKDRVLVKGEITAGNQSIVPGLVPLVGTHYLRSSSEPMKTAQERQFSKSGLPQYAEEERDWKATIRVYRSSSEPSEVLFMFQVRNAGPQITRGEFKLRLEAPQNRR